MPFIEELRKGAEAKPHLERDEAGRLERRKRRDQGETSDLLGVGIELVDGGLFGLRP